MKIQAAQEKKTFEESVPENFCLLSRALANAVLCPCNFFWIYKSEKESLSEGVVCAETVLYGWDILVNEGKEELDKYELNIWPVPQSSRDRLGGQERGERCYQRTSGDGSSGHPIPCI